MAIRISSQLYLFPPTDPAHTTGIGSGGFPPAPEKSTPMIYIVKTGIVFFLLGWTIFGAWLVLKYSALFGPHPDDPAESVGARSFGVTHIGLVWFGAFALAVYFLFR